MTKSQKRARNPRMLSWVGGVLQADGSFVNFPVMRKFQKLIFLIRLRDLKKRIQ
jgi:hypothetical protein